MLKNWKVSVGEYIAQHLKSEKYKSSRKLIRDNERYRIIHRDLGEKSCSRLLFCRSKSSETVLDTLSDKGSTSTHIALGIFNFAANTDVNVYISQEE